MNVPGGRAAKSSKPAGTVIVVRAGGPETPKINVTSSSSWSEEASTVKAGPSSAQEAVRVETAPAFVTASSRKQAAEPAASRAISRRAAIRTLSLGKSQCLGDLKRVILS